MFASAVQPNEPSLEISWKIFFETFGIESSFHDFYLPSGIYSPALWLFNEQIAVEIEGYRCAAAKTIRYQDAADQSAFPIICIKGLPQVNRYSVRMFVPKQTAQRYPRFYWAKFAEGEGGKLCLLEGSKFCYLQKPVSQLGLESEIESAIESGIQPNSASEMVLKALTLGNASYLVSLQSKAVAKI
jgi:hypothetical protein